MSTHMATAITRLLNKIERRLGTAVLNLPEHLSKNKWADIIKEDTLDTFSRFFPHKILYRIDTVEDKGKDGYYYIDEEKIGGNVVVYGIKDLALDKFIEQATSYGAAGYIDRYNIMGSVDDILMGKMSADLISMYNIGLYVDYVHPNKVSVKNATNHTVMAVPRNLDIYLFVKHDESLATISPTKMEEFERLAIVDTKIFLYEGLKHFDGLETVYAHIDLKINDWSNASNERDALVDKYKDQYVSASNFNQPIIYTV